MAAVDFYQVLGVSRTQPKKRSNQLTAGSPEIPSGCESGGQSLRGEVQAGFRGVRGAARPEKRASYDRFGSRWNQWMAGHSSTGVRPPTTSTAGLSSTSISPVSDLGDFGTVFETLFGHGAGAGTRQRVDWEASRRRTAGYEAQVEISLEEAYSGATRQVRGGGRPLTVNIPKGVATGSRIRLAGELRGRAARSRMSI